MSSPSAIISGNYLLAPQASTTTVLTMMSGSIALSGSSSQATLTHSDTILTLISPAAGNSQLFTITNDSAYAEGYITITYTDAAGDQQTAECHLNFFLNTTAWEQDTPGSYPNDNTTIFPAASSGGQPIVIPVTEPTNGGSGGIDSRFQVLNPEMVFLVDYRPEHKTMLFRGNTPFNTPAKDNGHQSVDFETLHQYMKAKYESQTGNSDFPALGSYTLRDVCLQSRQSERESIRWELESFGGKSVSELKGDVWVPADAGTAINQMCNWEIEPHTQPGNDVFDAGRAKKLSEMMSPATPNPFYYIYYIHCASGHDRTGIVASSYMIANRSLSLQRSLIYGTTLAKLSTTGGQMYANCQDLDGTNKGNIDPDRSRLMMIASVYDTTVLNIYNSFNPDSPESAIPADALSTNPAYVYSTYPWG